MDNNWRPTASVGEAPMDAGDWRTQLQPDSRQRIVNKIMETLKRHLPFSGQEGVQELKKIAVRFEEKIYTAATSQPDYLRKISLKMLTMENKSQNTIPNPLPANPAANNNKFLDPAASHSMQTQVPNQGQSLSLPSLPVNQSQAHQQLLSQNLQNNMAAAGVQGSAGLSSALPSVSGISQTPMASVVCQNNNMQNMSSMSQTVGNAMGQTMPSIVFTNAQRQIPGGQPVVPQQQQQQSQNSQYLYQQQLQQQLLKPKFQQPLMSSHIQQPQQQQNNLLQPNQLQSSQLANAQSSSVMQPSMMQSTGLQQSQPSSVQQSTSSLLQHQQSVSRQQQQAALIHQPQSQMMKQQLLSSQQQQLMVQLPNASNIQQNQLMGQQNNIGEIQQQQQQQRLLGQQNNLQNLQQQQLQQQQQQQLMAQQNNISTMHQQQLSAQNIVVLQQQQQLLGSQSGNPALPANQHAVQMLQSKVSMQQQSQQTGTNLLVTSGQQSQSQQSSQQLLSQMQSPATQSQQPVGLQQQPNPTQRDLQQRLQVSGQGAGSLLQSQSLIDQQKQLFQSQIALPETSSTSLDTAAPMGQINGGDWQEEVYQKVKQMKEAYLPELMEMYHKVAAKLQQHDSLSQQPKSDQLDKLKIFKSMVERMISVVQMAKSNITPGIKEKLPSYEKQILNVLTSNRPRKPVSSMQQGVPQPLMQSMQQSQSQAPHMQSHENHMSNPLQSMNLQGSAASMPHNSMSSLQHNSLPSIPGVSTSQQNIVNQLQSSSNMDAGQGNPLGSLQQVAVGSLQQNVLSTSQQSGISTLSSQSGVNTLQPNIPIQSNSNMLQQQHHFKQEQMLQTQQLKQIQQRQMQQYVQKQQQQQQQQPQPQLQHLHQQSKQQLPAQMQTQQIVHLHQMNDANEMKMRQGMGVKPVVFQQHLSTGQRATYPHQQMKSGSTFAVSSPQLLQSSSPQLPQHSSPQVDQQNVLLSLTKTGTPSQSANSPFVVPSPSTPMAPSPMPGDSEKPSMSNVGYLGHQQMNAAQAPAQSLAIGTPGISASPLLAEFTGTDGTHGALATVSGKSSVSEQPIERLLKTVKSVSSKALSASVSNIGSVVSMIDRIAGSAPGNGSRAAVGEDLVAMTKCRLQARNCVTQDGMNGTRKMKRYTSAVPLNVVSSVGSISDSFRPLTGSDTSDLESTATSDVKRPRIQANHVLMEEIREINRRLIDTVVDVSDGDVDPSTAAAAAEGGEGTIVKCSFNAVSLSPNLKLQYASAQLSPIQPLRLLVPANYPNCSPILLDKFPIEVSKEYEDLSAKAKSRFSISLRSLSQPMSLREIARTWDVCARAIISEHAQQSGGGTFSSKYGTWENYLSAA